MTLKRLLGATLTVVLLALLATYTESEPSSGPGATEASPAWAVPTGKEIERLKSERGMKATASELRAMKTASVQRVVDGDTVEVKTGTTTMKVRLLNVDTPETVDPRRPVEEYGREASNFTKSVLRQGTRVHYKYDVEKADQYGRQLLHLYLEDGTWFNALLIRAGFAQLATYPPNIAAAAYFRDLQRMAREESLGLWQIPKQ